MREAAAVSRHPDPGARGGGPSSLVEDYTEEEDSSRRCSGQGFSSA